MEVWIAEEVLKAGEEAMRECERLHFGQRETAIQVYLAMYGMQQLIELRREQIH